MGSRFRRTDERGGSLGDNRRGERRQFVRGNILGDFLSGRGDNRASPLSFLGFELCQTLLQTLNALKELSLSRCERGIIRTDCCLRHKHIGSRRGIGQSL